MNRAITMRKKYDLEVTLLPPEQSMAHSEIAIVHIDDIYQTAIDKPVPSDKSCSWGHYSH